MKDKLVQINAAGSYNDPGLQGYNLNQEYMTRQIMNNAAAYAEGGETFDPEGKYLCGSCIMRLAPDQCTHVDGTISMLDGSCNLYVYGGDNAFADWYQLPTKISQQDAGYAERSEAKGFGCFPRCGRAVFAEAPDPDGRDVWCGFWGTHVISTACCIMESGPDMVTPE